MYSKSLVNCIQYRDHSMKKKHLKFDMKQYILHADMHCTHILNHIMNIRYVHVDECVFLHPNHASTQMANHTKYLNYIYIKKI